MRRLICLVLAMISSSLPGAEPEGWGHLKGEIVVDEMIVRKPLLKRGEPIFAHQTLKEAQQGIPPRQIGFQLNDVPDPMFLVQEETKGLKNVFVYLQKAPAAIHPSCKEVPKTPVEFRRPDLFIAEPYALLIRVGQEMRLTNDALDVCNVHTYPLRNTSFNQVIPVGKTIPGGALPKAERMPIQVKDDIHVVVRSFWLPLDHPYAAITAADGSFEIKNLPAGKHEFAVWHAGPGFIERRLAVEIRPGETTTLPPLEVTAKRLLGEEE
ncbi:MAG: carboxypeptidase-like regulatory domain-containing protein [Planctomycetales bacterium]